MRKIYKIAVFVMLAVMAVTSTAFAADNNVSDWAKAEVSKTAELGLLPDDAFEGDLTRPITREEFARFSVFFLAAQYNMDINDFINSYLAAYEINPDYEAFLDADDGLVIFAHAVGIVAGYEDGTFRPNAEITRQEAAVMLLNTYDLYGMWKLQEKAYSFDLSFSDADMVSEWARSSVMFMYQIEVMNGTGDDTFAPLGKYTVEQSIITFLRLYENAPESRFDSTITHFMTFDESFAEVLATPFFRVNEQFDLEECVVVYGEITGVPHSPYFKLWIVYKDGGRREILQHLPQNLDGWQNDFNIRDVKLNDDKSALTFIRNYEGRDYYYSIDLKSAKLSEIDFEQ